MHGLLQSAGVALDNHHILAGFVRWFGEDCKADHVTAAAGVALTIRDANPPTPLS